MKRISKYFFLALVSVALTGCFGFGGSDVTEPKMNIQHLYSNGGLWLEDGTQTFFRFTDSIAPRTGYYWGWEWDEAEDIYEADVIADKDNTGNGKFYYTIKTGSPNDVLEEIELMNISSAQGTLQYGVTKLTEDELCYYNKDNTSETHTLHKMAEAKQ